VPSYTVGYIDVYRNGVRLVSTDFTATTGTTVVLVNACTSGDSVVTESFYVSSVLNAIPATAGSVSASNLAALSTIPSTAGNITVPAVTGTMMVSGNMPAFSAYPSSGTSVTASTYTKITFDTENFDTNSNFASSRFTPTVAGYYQITANIRFGPTTGTLFATALFKNGSLSVFAGSGASSVYVNPCVSAVLYFNGSTDYVEVYGYQNSAGTISSDSGTYYNFSGCLLRAA
jgi:hypothetical protein